MIPNHSLSQWENQITAPALHRLNPSQTRYIGSYSDVRFGHCSLFTNSSDNSRFIGKSKFYDSISQANLQIAYLKTRANLSNQYINNFLDYQTSTPPSTHGGLTLTYYIKVHDRDLVNVLESRKLSNDRFTIQEMTCLFYEVLTGMAYLEENKSLYGPISPYHIWLTGLTPLVSDQILETSWNEFFLEETKNGQNWKVFFAGKKHWWASPELYGFYFKNFNVGRVKESPINWEKSNVFSIGLIMLECGLLENVNERIWKEGSDLINREELRILIARFRE
jgi:hypothetical protein